MANNSAAIPAGAHVKAPDGTNVELRPLGLRDMADVDQAALSAYRRQRMSGLMEMAALRYGKGTPDYEAKLDSEENILAKITVDKLPLFEGVPITDLIGKDGKPLITEAKPIRLPWPTYWMQYSMEGLIFVTWLAARKATSLSLDQWDEKLTAWGPEFLMEMQDALGEIMLSKLGNQKPPT